MDSYEIQIEGLKLHGFHGVLPEEARLGQFFILDLFLKVARLGPEDQADQVVDYGAVSLAVEGVFSATRYQLIESLAEKILEALAEFQGIQTAKLKISKPSPPIPLVMKGVSVTLTRTY